jgi:hypothetical protein
MAAGPLLLFWVPIPAVAGLIGGGAGGTILGRQRLRAFEVAMVIAIVLAVPALIFGREIAEGLPLVGSVLATLIVLWFLLNCIALPIGAALGSAAAIRRDQEAAANLDGVPLTGWQSLVASTLAAIEARGGPDSLAIGEQAGEALRSLIEDATEVPEQSREQASELAPDATAARSAVDPEAAPDVDLDASRRGVGTPPVPSDRSSGRSAGGSGSRRPLAGHFQRGWERPR